MLIKKLTKAELDEGLTLEMVNSISLESNYSPIMLLPNDEPVSILKFSKGFWIMIDGKPLKNEKNEVVCINERECSIGRARFLLKYASSEKQQKIDALIEEWKLSCKQKIDEIKNTIDALQGTNIFSGIMSEVIENIHGKEAKEKYERESAQKLALLTPIYEQVSTWYTENKLIELLEYFNIKHFPALMLSAHIDNPEEVRVMRNTMGGEALKNWDGDILNRYAAIEIEKQYTF